MKLRLFIFSVSLIAIWSCNKNDKETLCIDGVEAEDIMLLANSEKVIPYGSEIDTEFAGEDTTKLIFKNSAYEEIEVNAYTRYTPIISTLNVRCEEDSTMTIGEKWAYIQKSVRLRADSVSLYISVHLVPIIRANRGNHNETDVLEFSISNTLSGVRYYVFDMFVNGLEIVDLRENTFIPEWAVFNSSFVNVYMGEIKAENFPHVDDLPNTPIFYNITNGIIGFEDEDGELWVFDREE